jgi:hypothetical protein
MRLDVIADFWKPAKKTQAQDRFEPELLQVGSSLGFGFVPQVILSGRRLHVSAINTYLFGEETLTSFVLTQDKDPGVSMIVAESDGEYYLAISRRISLNDRMKLFDVQELGNVLTRADALRLACRDNIVDYKGWLVSSYKREIQNLKGYLFKGDCRKTKAPSPAEGLEFEYTLLVSDSNEHAIEVEKYNDGRIEVYATVYRRLNDIGEITHPPLPSMAAAPTEAAKPEIKLFSQPEVARAPEAAAPRLESDKPEAKAGFKPEAPAAAVEPARASAIKLQEFTPTPTPMPGAESAAAAPVAAAAPAKAPEPDPRFAPPQFAPQFAMKADYLTTAKTEETTKETTMTTTEQYINGTRSDMSTAEAAKPKLYVQPNNDAFARQDIKAAGKLGGFDADSIECDLRVANKIIDEAIRNEMRLTDIVRRIIELPVANPESVQIPLTLNDDDYALLAIRYGITAADRNAIKRRILEDLNDFSGNKKKGA